MDIIVFDARGHMGEIVCRRVREKQCGALIMTSSKPEGDMLPLYAVSRGDCIIDFSHHAATADVCGTAARLGLPLVEATTGQTEEEKRLIEQTAKLVPVFFSGNMSVGIALLMRLARETAKCFPDADIEIVEAHHNRKIDVPSGTALMLAESVREARPNAEMVVGRHENGKRAANEVGIHSLRMGNIVGMHEVIVNAGSQSITLKHEAYDRALFADGALAAAEFIVSKSAGLYGMADMV
ncbi:MAG: 4-hydroxy-tetrahydrodipicolinate reductase [Oscillospiraceae bacterium]|nr:4-hydroxy-tetrahydrodipicolinate reductase [Oscillospiraceae bacterium]